MSGVAALLETPWVYRLWQMPFARAKLRPLLRATDLGAVRRVLDVGCGPGTSAPYFAHCQYRGIDINPDYIEYAKRRFKGEFLVADVTQLTASSERYDFVLVNSMLHHLDDNAVRRLLGTLGMLLSRGGHVHVLELVTPSDGSIAGFLARHDRGVYSRTVDEWRRLVGGVLTLSSVEPYALRGVGLTLWNMVYVKARGSS